VGLFSYYCTPIKREILKQLFSISSGNFSEIVQPVLAIRVGTHHFSFAITNAAASRLYQLAYYSADEINTELLNEIFSAHAGLNNSFFQILICYDYANSIIVPSIHYNADNAGLLLSTINGDTAGTTVVSETVAGWQVNNVYTVPAAVHEWMNRKFPSGKIGHNYSLGIRNIRACDVAGCISIDVLTNDLTVIACKENKLLLAQSFSYSVPADVAYYLLKTCQQLDLSQEHLKLFLSGLIEKDSALYKELHQYFMNLEIREASWNSNEYPAHFFTSLNDLARCAL
jgi:hypothetical protein